MLKKWVKLSRSYPKKGRVGSQQEKFQRYGNRKQRLWAAKAELEIRSTDNQWEEREIKTKQKRKRQRTTTGPQDMPEQNTLLAQASSCTWFLKDWWKFQKRSALSPPLGTFLFICIIIYSAASSSKCFLKFYLKFSQRDQKLERKKYKYKVRQRSTSLPKHWIFQAGGSLWWWWYFSLFVNFLKQQRKEPNAPQSPSYCPQVFK